ncbi:AIM24 family protein [Gulosibacter molinativorax]|uniref:AIM24 family protein n=1 Tax=Gulosibacter molinativorax TaxID=256821 RepID=A0ABT7C763_9MICO|nr:AIM24 family protein [Gulosibacter molinativorax]MDJ1371002.1 AIM24 family protein [Gulosibacter molinativorax]QUY62796.1 Stress protein [Gulosibacter molinativorax]
MQSDIFSAEHQPVRSQKRWAKQNSRMLRVGFGPDVIAANGSMVSYIGQFDFKYEGSGGSMGKFMKKMVSGEGSNIMRISGQGEVYLAKQAQQVFLIQLGGDAITLNTRSLLAFDANLNWDIKSIGNAGIMSGGLFNLVLEGNGVVALSSDGDPLVLDASQRPVFVDPQAAVCWSANLVPQLKNDFKMGSLIGRGSGESFQLGFHGPGFVVVQPSEGVVGTVQAS